MGSLSRLCGYHVGLIHSGLPLMPGTAVFVDIKDDMSAMFDPCYPALEMLVLCCDLTLGFRCTCCLSVMC